MIYDLFQWLFGERKEREVELRCNGHRVKPASEDPYGDPGAIPILPPNAPRARL